MCLSVGDLKGDTSSLPRLTSSFWTPPEPVVDVEPSSCPTGNREKYENSFPKTGEVKKCTENQDELR